MRIMAAVLVVALAAVFATAQETDGLTDPKALGEAMLSGSSEEIGRYLGMDLTVQDEIVFIHKDHTEFPGYMKFSTAYLMCRIIVKDSEDQKLLERYTLGEIFTLKGQKFKDKQLELLRGILYDEVAPHRIRLEGELMSPDEYGDLSEDEKGLVKRFYIFDVKKVMRPMYTTPERVDK